MKIEYAYGFIETSTEPVDAAAKIRNACVQTDPPQPRVESTAECGNSANIQILERGVSGPSFVARVYGTPEECNRVIALVDPAWFKKI